MSGREDDASLAEGRWFWRRLYVYGLTAGLGGLLALSVMRAPALHQPLVAESVGRLMALVIVVYLVAPSAQHLVVILARRSLRTGGRP